LDRAQRKPGPGPGPEPGPRLGPVKIKKKTLIWTCPDFVFLIWTQRKERKGKEKEREKKGKERKGKGKERERKGKGKERKGKGKERERKGKGKERKITIIGNQHNHKNTTHHNESQPQ
jgi:hypothetical protein